MKYQEKPNVIDAIEVSVEHLPEIIKLAKGYDVEIKASDGELKEIRIRGEHNTLSPSMGDYMVIYTANIGLSSGEEFRRRYVPVE